MMRSPIPELDLRRIERMCDQRVPDHGRDKVRIELEVNGSTVAIYESRAPWDPRYGPAWTRTPIASLRYSPSHRWWSLFWADHNGRWHRYPDTAPTPTVDDLVAHIDRDPLRLFWG